MMQAIPTRTVMERSADAKRDMDYSCKMRNEYVNHTSTIGKAAMLGGSALPPPKHLGHVVFSNGR